MNARWGKWLRTIVIVAAGIQYAYLAANALSLVCFHFFIERGPSCMPALALLIWPVAEMGVGLLCGYVVYRICTALGDGREVAFAWGALAALLGPILTFHLVVWLGVRGAPQWLCFLLGGVISIILPVLLTVLLRWAATRYRQSQTEEMNARWGKWLRTEVIAAASIEHGLLAAVVIWALAVEVTGGMGCMPFHLLALVFIAPAMGVGLLCGYVVYRISTALGDAREVAFAWGALAALLGPALSLVVCVNVPAQSAPRWLCFLLGGVISIILPLLLRWATTRHRQSRTERCVAAAVLVAAVAIVTGLLWVLHAPVVTPRNQDVSWRQVEQRITVGMTHRQVAAALRLPPDTTATCSRPAKNGGTEVEIVGSSPPWKDLSRGDRTIVLRFDTRRRVMDGYWKLWGITPEPLTLTLRLRRAPAPPVERDGASGAQASATPVSAHRLRDQFSYPDGALNGNGGWSGSANSSQIAVVSQTVKIIGGSGSRDAKQTVSCSAQRQGCIWVRCKVRRGSGTSTNWNLWINDSSGRNFARWYGTGEVARARIGSTDDVTPVQTLTGGWDDIDVKITPAAKTSRFFFNGTSIGTLSYSSQRTADVVAQLRFERGNNSGASGQYVFLDDLRVAGD